jgi:hypothetical protein
MTKRIQYPVNKEKIVEAIELYEEYSSLMWDETDKERNMSIWLKYCDVVREICPEGWVHVAAASLFQAMRFAGNLTVENVYNAIIASGINTRMEEIDND